MQTSKLVRISEDGSLAYFNMVLSGLGFLSHGESYDDRIRRRWENLANKQATGENVIDYIDLGFAQRVVRGSIIGGKIPVQQIRFGPYYNDGHLPWKDVDYDRHEIPIEWKKLFTDFFQEEAYIRHQKQALHSSSSTGPAPTYIETAEKALEAYFGPMNYVSDLGNEDAKWFRQYGKEEDELRQEAYEWRLKRAHARAGMEIDLDKMCKEFTSSGMDPRAYARIEVEFNREWQNTCIAQDWAAKCGIESDLHFDQGKNSLPEGSL